MFVKTKTKHASKGGIELAVFKAFRELLLVKLLNRFSLVHTGIYDAHKQAHNKEKEIKVLPLSSNQKKLRYEDRKNIVGRFYNDTAEIILEMVWSNFETIGGFFAHEMIGGV